MSRATKLYCYVDETGQDASSTEFIVVAVVIRFDQNDLRSELLHIERLARTEARKWRKLRQAYRMAYMDEAIRRGTTLGSVYFSVYAKPVRYMSAILETVGEALALSAAADDRAIVVVDALDNKKALEFTRTLRSKGLRVDLVRGARDESEPGIRYADMWAGCIRAALSDEPDARERFLEAMTRGCILRVGPAPRK